MKQTSCVIWGLLISALWLPAHAAAPLPLPLPWSEQHNPSYSLSNTLTYDDNLYRLAPGVDVEQAGAGNNTRREDYIDQTSLAAAARLFAGRQSFDAVARVDDNRYRYNDALDYVGGNGTLKWNWLIGHDWSGDLGGEYKRSLAGFENNKLLKKDLLTRVDYFYDVENLITPRWSWNGGIRRSETTHGIDEHEPDNIVLNTAKLGLGYETPRNDKFGIDYQFVGGRFPERASEGKTDEDYDQGTSDFWLKYLLTEKTSIDAHIGYLQRNYDDAAFDDYSGGTGHVKLQWLPSVKTQFKLYAWRELRAYIDAESDYYVSRGVKISPIWQPRDVLKFSLEFSRENQEFVGLALPAGVQDRHDTVYASQIAAFYTPIPLLQIDLKCRAEHRNSNRTLLDYHDRITSVGLTLNF